jgi:hypothetical protein
MEKWRDEYQNLFAISSLISYSLADRLFGCNHYQMRRWTTASQTLLSCSAKEGIDR